MVKWVVPGDTFTGKDSQIITDTPFFRATIEGGWFKATKTMISTKQNMDPALALLLAHLVTSEFSIVSIKTHLRANTPPATNPPHPSYGGNFNQAMSIYQAPFALSGQYNQF